MVFTALGLVSLPIRYGILIKIKKIDHLRNIIDLLVWFIHSIDSLVASSPSTKENLIIELFVARSNSVDLTELLTGYYGVTDSVIKKINLIHTGVTRTDQVKIYIISGIFVTPPGVSPLDTRNTHRCKVLAVVMVSSAVVNLSTVFCDHTNRSYITLPVQRGSGIIITSPKRTVVPVCIALAVLQEHSSCIIGRTDTILFHDYSTYHRALGR